MTTGRLRWLIALMLVVGLGWTAGQSIGATSKGTGVAATDAATEAASASIAKPIANTQKCQPGESDCTPQPPSAATPKVPSGPTAGCQPGQKRCMNTAMRRAVAERNHARRVAAAKKQHGGAK